MASFEFLSPEWIAAARALREEYGARLPPGGDGNGPAPGRAGAGVVANVVIAGAPFDRSRIEGHIDTTDMDTTVTPVIDEGHRSDADLTIELPYDLARRLFCRRDPQAFFQAVFAGQVKVTGDSSKLLQITLSPAAEPHPLAAELGRRLDEITE